jgi:SAM-dependent methyltransferase
VSESPFLFGDRRRADSFGDDAEQYDRVRPGYPTEMVDELMKDAPSRVLDVGCGTGIASRLFLARGCQVLGLEPDVRMAAVARRRGVTVEVGRFEDWEWANRRFDLLIAAQAWHWVDPHAGAAKAAEVVQPGGRIGLFWNQANPDPRIRTALGRAYARHAPELGENSVLLGQRDFSLYRSIADAVRDTGRFEQVEILRYNRQLVYTTEVWLELTVTHSDHRKLEDGPRAGLISDLRTEIDREGGRVPVRYETVLVTGRTRPADQA